MSESVVEKLRIHAIHGCGDVGLLRKAADEIERLQAIVDKLPKTADGVAIVPGMQCSVSIGGGHFRHNCRIVAVTEDFDGKGYCVRVRDADDEWWSELPATVYSTREAAEAALEEQTKTEDE